MEHYTAPEGNHHTVSRIALVSTTSAIHPEFTRALQQLDRKFVRADLRTSSLYAVPVGWRRQQRPIVHYSHRSPDHRMGDGCRCAKRARTLSPSLSLALSLSLARPANTCRQSTTHAHSPSEATRSACAGDRWCGSKKHLHLQNHHLRSIIHRTRARTIYVLSIEPISVRFKSTYTLDVP